jgi:type IV secretory pathway protease TraF
LSTWRRRKATRRSSFTRRARSSTTSSRGEGVYVLDGVEHPVRTGDVVVVPPQNSIYFVGRFRAVLVTVPPWEESGERHIRDLEIT